MLIKSPMQKETAPTRQVRRVERVMPPPYRRLRGYAFDPSLSIRLDTAQMNEIVFKVMWEDLDDLSKGPVGEYVEVLDFDPASGCFYEPLDLDNPLVLAQDGLAPSEGNPQFHQQMVYAVAMTTIQHFEVPSAGKCSGLPTRFHRRRRRADRAVYTASAHLPARLARSERLLQPRQKALLFGYFPASPSIPGAGLPGGTVFTCLSHDIIAHETTHALLDGVHRRFIEATGPDALAFHEAFADIVALFQHFTFPDVVAAQIAKTRGDLSSENLLGQLAEEFGTAIGNYGSLRDALGATDPQTGQWKPYDPDPNDYQTVFEPHDRGAILVGAVFDAFISIYKSRVADLMRIASSGTGILQAGALHPDLVGRLADEASRAAQGVLQMCIRALDYCPPVDITFGDYLRAMITADADLVANDDRGYRIAFIEAFRRRGIYPKDVRTLSVESLRWQRPQEEQSASIIKPIENMLRQALDQAKYYSGRKQAYDQMRALRARLHDRLSEAASDPESRKAIEAVTGLVLDPDRKLSGLRLSTNGLPRFEVHSVAPVHRVGPDGNLLSQIVINITQKREWRAGAKEGLADRKFTFRGGCTLILDLENRELLYSVNKSISDKDAQRLAYQKQYLQDDSMASLRATYFGAPGAAGYNEPLALLHRNYEQEDFYGRS